MRRPDSFGSEAHPRGSARRSWRILHDVGHQDGIDYLVMEYVEGTTLAKRLEKGPVPLEQALKCEGEIADALDKAHHAGIR